MYIYIYIYIYIRARPRKKQDAVYVRYKAFFPRAATQFIGKLDNFKPQIQNLHEKISQIKKRNVKIAQFKLF